MLIKSNNTFKEHIYAIEFKSNLIAYEFKSEEIAETAINMYKNKYYLRIENTPITDKEKWTINYPKEWNKINEG